MSEWERALGAALLCPPNHLPEMDVSSGNWPPKKSASNSLILNSAEQIQPTSMPPPTHTLFSLSFERSSFSLCALEWETEKKESTSVKKKVSPASLTDSLYETAHGSQYMAWHGSDIFRNHF